MPVLHVLAGPNGAGKSTYVERVIAPATAGVLPFIDAGLIAADRWPGTEAAHAYDAARAAAAQRGALMAQGRSFITETVFSHPSKVDLLADALALGYLVHLHVVIVPVELTVARVHDRVRRGGHAVPEEKIRARYERLWAHVATAARTADVTEVLDNSSPRRPFRVVATLEHGRAIATPTWPAWTPPELKTLAAGG